MDRTKSAKEYHGRLPERIQARITSTEEGLWARLTSHDGRLTNCFTQAANATELITMANDAILTYFEIPEDTRADVGYYIPLSENHVRLEEMFNQLVAIEKQVGMRNAVEATLTLKDSKLQVC